MMISRLDFPTTLWAMQQMFPSGGAAAAYLQVVQWPDGLRAGSAGGSGTRTYSKTTRYSEVPPVPARHVDHRRCCDARHEDSAAGMVLGGISGDNADARPIGDPVSTATWSESL